LWLIGTLEKGRFGAPFFARCPFRRGRMIGFSPRYAQFALLRCKFETSTA
jgi:hypothetical protein